MRWTSLGAGLAPAILAGVVVWLEPILTEWSKGREAMLPLVVVLLLACILHPNLRQGLIISLCYGVAFMALRDMVRSARMPLPEFLNYDFMYQFRPLALLSVAILAAIAGLAETLQPGTVWARRCYFGAASLYFTGLGVLTLAEKGSWQAVILIFTGLTALGGCLLAHRIVAAEAEEEAPEPPPDDVVEQQEREARHRRRLQEKEWRESSEAGIVGARSSPTRSP